MAPALLVASASEALSHLVFHLLGIHGICLSLMAVSHTTSVPFSTILKILNCPLLSNKATWSQFFRSKPRGLF